MRGLVGQMDRAGRVGLVGRVGLAGRVGLVGIFILLIAIFPSSIIYAGDPDSVSLMVGRSAIVDTGAPIARVSLTSADIADALVTASNELLINGKAPGTISMFVWDRSGGIRRYEVTVQRDLARLSDQLKELFPGEAISAHSSGKAVVLSGKVSSQPVADKASSVAAGYVEKKEDVVNLLQISETAPSNQVLLRVRFAEVSRTAITELGANFFTSPNGEFHNLIGRTSTEQFAAPTFDNQNGTNKLIFSDFLNFFVWDFKHDLGAVIRALQNKGLFQSLAEPNLVAESGKEASFLAGGEIPVPVAQPNGGGVTVVIEWKEFGIRLNFTPTVVGDRVHLKVRPEVSTLDFNNAITLQGFRIPALSTRRTETELELQNGQTFSIAGLINNQINKSMQKVPGIGDIPILGYLFRSEAAQKDRTELVVMITPEILSRNSRGVTGDLPRGPEQYLPVLPPRQQRDNPPPAFTPGSFATGAAAAMPLKAQPKANGDDAAAAAATVQALTPTTRPLVTAPADAPSAVPAPERPMKRDEQAAIERAQKDSAKPPEVDRRKADQDAKARAEAEKRQLAIEKAAVEAQAKRDADKAKRDAELAKKQAEQNRKQAELDKKRQKAVEEAQAKMKAAQAEYDAELAKVKKDQQQKEQQKDQQQ